jgi:predicted transcriptional regulator
MCRELSADGALREASALAQAVHMRTPETRHLHIEIPPDLFERINAIAGCTGVARTAWIVAALTEAESAASWHLDAVSRLAAMLAENDQVRARVGEAYLAHDDVALRALLERYMRREE